MSVSFYISNFDMTYQEYFKRFVAGALLAAAAVVTLNIVIDPLDVFRVVKIKNLNLYKTAYSSYARLAKPMQIEMHQPTRLALGSSRVFLGIPMDQHSWSEGKGFNAGMNGATIKTVVDLFEHATAVSDVQDALISTDLFMFNVNQLSAYPNKLARDGESAREKAIRQASLFSEALFSPDITAAMFETMRKQDEKYNKFLPSGQTNPEYEQKKSMRDGYINRFLQFEDSLVRVAWSRCRDNQFPFAKDGKNSFDELDRILRLAGEKNIRLRLFISPIHARVFETMSAAGLWDEFEEMKIQLVMHAQDARNLYPSLDVQVWDFSGYNPLTSEAIPSDPTQSMLWFYDSSHFSDAVGRMILDEIYLESSEKKLGTRITTYNIGDHLAKIRREQQDYRNKNQQQFDQINATTKAILEDKKINGDVCTPLIK